MAQLAEVLLAQTVQGRTVHLRGAADEVVNLRLEWLAVGVVPDIRRDVAVVDEDGLRVPVQRFTFQPVAALENQDALPGRREMARQRAASRAAADDDDVVVLRHETPPSQPGLLCIRPPSANTVVAVM